MAEKKVRLALICSIIVTIIGSILWSIYVLLILAKVLTIFGGAVTAALLLVWLILVCG